MRISVIICTYGRAAVLKDLLESLHRQTFRDFETLIVDGNEEPSPARNVIRTFLQPSRGALPVSLIKSAKGLTHQRNVGIARAKGELLCFLDDDVTLPEKFLLQVSEIFEKPEFEDVGGVTGYDTVNCPMPVTLRWRMRRALGVIPNLGPGGVDRLGRGIPVTFLQPFTGYREVGLLPGYCMIYRSVALGRLRFDELIPTYGGEDRDFSMQLGWRSRLLICGDLHLEHHASPEGRDSHLQRNFQSAYGMGRRFAKFSRGPRDVPRMILTFLGDFAIDVLFLCSRPSRANLEATTVRIKGFFAGLRSERTTTKPSAPYLREVHSAEQSGRVSSVR